MPIQRWSPSGVIALTTDFGLSDPYVGQMKAVILARGPALRLVDLTHGVPPQDVRVGAFFLERSRRFFAPGTVHVAVVDPGVGSARRLLVAEDGGQCFVGPDNGLLASCLGEDAQVFELDVERFALQNRSHTFHGRDVMAPVAAALALGLDATSAGRARVSDWVRLPPRVLTRSAEGSRLEVEVLFRDRYGNLVLDVSASDIEPPLSAWSVRMGPRTVRFRETYAQVETGEALLLVDSYAALEIAVRDGDAGALLGLARGMRVTLAKDEA